MGLEDLPVFQMVPLVSVACASEPLGEKKMPKCRTKFSKILVMGTLPQKKALIFEFSMWPRLMSFGEPRAFFSAMRIQSWSYFRWGM